MSNYCSNRLNIYGDKNKVISFLYDFYSNDHIFKMKNIITNDSFTSIPKDDYNRSIWGTKEDIYNSDDMETVLCTYNEIKKGYGIFTINYLTINGPNTVFIKNASKLYNDFSFEVNYFNNEYMYCGESLYKNGIEEKNIYREYNKNKADETTIEVIDLAIKTKMILPIYLDSILDKCSKEVKNHFIEKEDDDEMILNFDDIQKEHIINDIKIQEI